MSLNSSRQKNPHKRLDVCVEELWDKSPSQTFAYYYMEIVVDNRLVLPESQVGQQLILSIFLMATHEVLGLYPPSHRIPVCPDSNRQRSTIRGIRYS